MTDLKSLVGVVVLYKCSIEESSTIISLQKSLDGCEGKLQLLVIDNGPEKQYFEESFENGPFDITYKHDPSNPGISKGYNEGVEFAISNDASWILLLDQDTEFGIDFIDSYLRASEKYLPGDIVCLLPQILSHDDKVVFSPSKMYPGGIIRPAKNIKPGIISEPITSINSGTFISLNFIESIGGFSNDYPLDMLDHWYFREIKKTKKKIILLNSFAYHNLSVISFFEEVSIDRYKSILYSENKFFGNRISDLGIYKLRLIIRLVRQLIAGKKDYAKLTCNYLINKLP